MQNNEIFHYVEHPSEASLTRVGQERFSYVTAAFGINRRIIQNQKNTAALIRACMFIRKAITNSPIQTLSCTVDTTLVVLGAQ
jgi:hypothetical protein